MTEAHLEAAGACFWQKGFHQTTMHEICSHAELSPGTVYRYFAGNENIIAAMVEARRDRLEVMMGGNFWMTEAMKGA